MANEDEAILAVKKFSGKHQDRLRWWLAYAGDGNGNVYTSQANYYLVRYPLASSPTVEIFNNRINLVDNLRIIVGYTAYQPNLLQVLDVADQRLDEVSPTDAIINPGTIGYSHVYPHWVNHQYLGADSGYINWRQVSALGVFPTSPPSLSVQIWPGTIPRPGTDVNVIYQSFDLTSHVPVSGARYVLISYDNTGAVVATDGTAVPGGLSALTNADVPATPAGNWRSCAVALYAGQTAIVETTTEVDFLDLRFPEETIAGSVTPDQIAGSTAQYQYIVSGSGPTFTPAWSGGFLNITSGKTLTVTDNISLPGVLAGYVPYTGATGGVDLNNQSLVNVSHLGVGTATVPDILLRAVGDNGSVSRLAVRGYSNNAASSAIRVTKFRGTAGTPVVPSSGDSLGMFQFAGYSGLTADGIAGAYLEAKTTETWTTTQNGTSLYFNVTQTGTAGPSLALTINQDKSAVFASSVSMISGLIAGTAGAGYLDFTAQSANPAAPAAGVVRFHSATTQGFTRFEQDNEAPTNLVLGRDNVFIAKNTSGGNIAAGKPVYVTGSTGNVPNIALAKADSTTTLPVVGMTLDPINNNNFGQVMVVGIIAGIDTSAFASGDQLWVSPTTAGGLVKVRPVYPNLVARVGSVLVSGVGNGSLLIDIAPFIGGLESGTTAATWTGTTLDLAGTSNQIVLQSAGVTGTLTWTPASTNKTITLPNLTGTVALGAGTLTSSTTNDVTVAAHTHAITGSPALLGDGTAQYQYIVTGSTPFAPGYSGGFLNITAGKTLTVTDDTTLPSGAAPIGANPTASIGLTVVNGIATTFMRSDAAPPLDVSINPTWSGNHIFSNQIKIAATSNQLVLQSAGITGTLTWTPTSTNKTITFPNLTGTLPIGTGTAGRIAEWVTNANTLQASTLIKTGAGVLTILADQTGEISFEALTHFAHFDFSNLTADRSYLLVDRDGTIPLGAATSSVSSANDPNIDNHTHAVTSSANPGAAASLLATDASGNLTIAGILTGSNTTDSSSTSTGGIVASGGVGIAKALTVGGLAGFGASPTAHVGVDVLLSDANSGGTVFGTISVASVTGATANARGLYGRVDTAASSFTLGEAASILAANPTAGTGSTITTAIGVHIGNITSGGTNYALYADGAMTYLGGGLRIGADGGGAASTTGFTNATNTTLTNAYTVKGGQTAGTINTGWIKIYIGTATAWLPYWANATP